MNTEFLKLPWHDAEILSISIDRSMAGEKDEIRVSVRWPDKSESLIIFTECYAFNATMNFGIIAPESVLNVATINNRDDVEEIKKRWSHVGVDLAELICYQIETNSTASKLFIYALSFSVQQL